MISVCKYGRDDCSHSTISKGPVDVSDGSTTRITSKGAEKGTLCGICRSDFPRAPQSYQILPPISDIVIQPPLFSSPPLSMHWALLLLLLGACDAVVTLRSGKYCFEGCDLTLSYVDFNDTDAVLSKKIRTCRSVLRATSLYLCAEEYCVETGRDEWLRDSNETCLRLNQALPPYSIVKHYTPEDVAGIRRLQAKEGMWNSKSPPVGEVVLPDQAFFERAFKTLVRRYLANYQSSLTASLGLCIFRSKYSLGIWVINIFHYICFMLIFPSMAMYLFWAIVITIGMCTRLTHLIQNLHRREWQPVPSSDLEAEDAGISKYHADSSKPYALLKRYIIFPATFGYSCSQNVGWCTIPPRIQTLTIFSFVFLNTLLCCISYPVFSENLYWPLVSTQLWRYISDRTGVISLANFPLVWLFGTRNNLLMWLTGWGFGCYNNFHRWVARVATVQAVVHSIGYTEMIFEREYVYSIQELFLTAYRRRLVSFHEVLGQTLFLER